MAKKGMSEVLLASAIAALLKKDKLEVRTAELNEKGDGIDFTAVSESGQLRVSGSFSDPQQELDLEEQDAAQ
jgi:hypothetical protein